MKNLSIIIIFIFSLFVNPLFSQEFIDLQNGEDTQINGLLVSYTIVKKENKKGADLYRLTATITNQAGDYIRVFDSAPKTFVENPENALAYFQFTNATGKALSATSAHFYPKPMYLKVPYECKKCPPPTDKDEDPNEHYTKTVIMGTRFASGSTLNKVLNIRVPEGEIPVVRVMIY